MKTSLEIIKKKYEEWRSYYTKLDSFPVRIYISSNWWYDLVDEASLGIFTETAFNDRQGVRVLFNTPVYLIVDSDYFMVEGQVLAPINNNRLPHTKQLESKTSLTIDI